MTRFLLDLQAANQRDVKLDSDDPMHRSNPSSGSLDFARVMGSIGEIISGSADGTEEDERQAAEGEIHDGGVSEREQARNCGRDGSTQEEEVQP